MLLRVSGEAQGTQVDVQAVNGDAVVDQVTHGRALVAFTEAVMGTDEALLRTVRDRTVSLLGWEAFVDTCAVIGSFNVVDRVADATGIPLDPILQVGSQAVREELGLGRFAFAVNSPGA